MNPTISGVIGPGFLNQVPTLPWEQDNRLLAMQDEGSKEWQVTGNTFALLRRKYDSLIRIDHDRSMLP